jgi:prepilin-type processing-associated H-X9-DG protein
MINNEFIGARAFCPSGGSGARWPHFRPHSTRRAERGFVAENGFVMRTRGFTLIELLVVTGIIILLIAILIPSILWAREVARRAMCASNQRHLMLGAMAFSNDHAGALIYASTGGGCWVGSGNDALSMASGQIFPYINGGPLLDLSTVNTNPPSAIKLFVCPSDFVKTNIRSYSINTYLADTSYYNPTIVFRWNQIKNPAKTFYLLCEYDNRGYNINGFVVSLPVGNPTWVDIPGLFHSDGCNLTFADGHLEWWHWGDPRTLALTPGAAGAGISTPNNADEIKLQSVAAP